MEQAINKRIPSRKQAAHSLEEFGEWIAVGHRNTAHLGARWTQIAQSNVNGKVAQFAELQRNRD